MLKGFRGLGVWSVGVRVYACQPDAKKGLGFRGLGVRVSSPLAKRVLWVELGSHGSSRVL